MRRHRRRSDEGNTHAPDATTYPVGALKQDPASLAVAVTGVGFARVAQLRFDEDMVDFLEVVNRRRDIVRRRHLVHEALAAQPGERVLDVGCGPGFYVAELLDAVGTEGWVTGVDSEPAMLAVAAKRAEGRDNVAFYEAKATGAGARRNVRCGRVRAGPRVCAGRLGRVSRDTPRAAARRPRRRLGRRLGDGVVARRRSRANAADARRLGPALGPSFATADARAAASRRGLCGRDHARAHVRYQRARPGDPRRRYTPLIVQYAVEQGGVDSTEAAAWKAEQDQLAAHGEFYSVYPALLGARNPGYGARRKLPGVGRDDA